MANSDRAGGKATDIDAGMVQRAGQGSLGQPQPTDKAPGRQLRRAQQAGLVRGMERPQPTIIPGADQAWMGPLQPIPVSAPANVAGRALDYPVGYNITTNRDRLGQPTIQELRNLARLCWQVSTAVETRKDQMETGNWDFKLRDDRTGFKSVGDPRIQELRDFFAFPDRRLTTNRWVRKWLDDALVVDAPCIWVQKARSGKPLEMRVIDTGTIKPLIDDEGMTPLPPAPAYQQWIKGVPAANYMAAKGPDVQFTVDEMIWHPKNPRPDKLFGYSAVEQVYVMVNTAIRRELLILDGYTEGNIPEAMIPVPEGWSIDQITEFQIYWDELLSGQLGQQRRARFVPNGLDKAVYLRKMEEKTEYDEWIVRVVMFAFSLPPTPFIKQSTRTSADQGANQASDEGFVPLVNYCTEMFNLLIWRFWKYTDIEAVFRRERTSNEKEMAEAAQIRIFSGQTSVDEERGDAGREAIGQGPAVMVPAIGLVAIGKAAEEAKAKQDEQDLKMQQAGKPAPGEEGAVAGDELLGAAKEAKLGKTVRLKKAKPAAY